VALAILGLIAAAFLGSLATAAQATFIADERATAESLARSVMEDVKSQDYINYDDPEHVNYVFIMPPANPNYSVEIAAVPFDPATGLSYDETGGIFVHDYDIQKITVTVYRGTKSVLTVDGYKVDRYEAE